MQVSNFRLQSTRSALQRFTTLLLITILFLAPLQSWGEDNGHAKLNRVKHIIVVYQENWSFDSLYGDFPGANGLDNSSATSLNQLDRVTGQPLSTMLGQPFNRVSAAAPQLSTPPEPMMTGTQK